ncbi:hypothetical protein MRB53_007173 [Persea americana]|uniref:Uncharacterized protein n=1 Tax=Persea americana TaxID=3435 RepID=A0ACC2MJ45_PERAE|nr:hypothetical protein MRB53_007173 [Persea americana]|eukprot:TRINITY_DN9540_c0_g1_i1.p1 TRINITY_DN9540_c0_g1~~TRINITY_DN9540_c0_g1_i1.p1  ORF type:complete len:977 (+),score=239.03 TRINITY_DN9540_c0_g1_i1:152-3082(+)
MAASPSRSPSPITGRRNPIGRTPESGNSIRKSLGGYPAAKPSIAAPRSFNPITPANSPSDFPHRNLSSKEGIRASYEKENERDQSSLNLSKAKSPVIISKGAKNFMAPTISAASKFTPSPRKKVLAERNEAVRTSTSIPDGKTSLPSMSLVQSSETEEIRSKSEVDLDSQVVSDTPKISHILPKPKTADFGSKEDLGSSSFPVLTSLELSKTEKIGSKPVMGLDSHPASDSPKIPEILPIPRTIDSDSKEDLSSSSLELSKTEKIGSKPVMGLDSHPASDSPRIPEILPIPRTIDSDSKEDLSSSSLEFSKTEKIGSKSVLGLDPQQFSDTLKAPETQNPSSLRDSTSADIDPSLPPYDPKTNYLSPRPRFLHYKPNPRIEAYLNKENSEGKNLEDSFTSESSSDSEPIEETLSPDAETDSADSFSPEIKAENAADSHPLEHELDECDAHEENREEEESIVAKEIPPKSSLSSSRPKFMSLLLVLAIVCVSMSVTDSPVISSSSMFNDHPLTKTYAPELRVLADRYLRDSFAEITEFASVNLGRVSDNLRLWSLNSMSYLARMISVPRGGELVVIHFMNLTALDTDISSVSKLLTDVNQIKDTGKNEEENSSEELKMEGETQQGVQEEQGLVKEEQHHYSEALETIHKMEVTEKPRETTVLEEQQEDQISLDLITAEEIVEAEEIEEKGVSDSHVNIEPTNVEVSAKTLHSEEIVEAEGIKEKGLSDSHADIEPNNDVEISAQNLHSVEIVETEEIEEKCFSNSHADIDPTNVELSAQSSHSDPDYEARSSPEVLDTTIRAPADDFTMQIVLGISSILLTLAAAAAASFYLKKSKVFVSEAEILKQPSSPKKMTSDSVSASSQSHTDIDRPLFYKNCPAEVEMVGESGPLEMSSSLEDSFSTSQHSSDRVEIKSHERKLRRNSNRESMVSSSEYSAGSPSYGSFTTYEKLHKVSGDDDAMTPVRRSSRLRKQITSP